MQGSYDGSMNLNISGSENPTHSFIFLHGYDSCGKFDSEHIQSWCHANTTKYEGLRVVCPDAHLLTTSANGYKKKKVHSWYDFKRGDCLSADDEPVIPTLIASCKEIHKIIESEARIVGISNVILGGCSQGCGAAFHALSTSPFGPIGGFYGSIGHVMPCTNVENVSSRINGPIVFYSGADDKVINWKWAKDTFARLENIPKVELWREDGVQHEDDGHFIANFLTRILPPPTVQNQLKAYEIKDFNTTKC